MDEETLRLLTNLHINNQRQGPGSEEAFTRALDLSGIDTESVLQIADIGCGTGSASLSLLRHTKARVTAIDLLPAFLEKLNVVAKQAAVSERLKTIEADMATLPFSDEQFDVIWSEGAIYNVGFTKGVTDWRRFLKKDGVLVVSEITWLRRDVPEPLLAHWTKEYPEVTTASEKMRILEEAGYSPLGYFSLSSDCWLENYYRPLQATFATFLQRHGHSAAAEAIVAAEEKETALYEQYQDYVSYGMYIARKVE